MGLQATMQMYAELMKEAAPEARSDIMKAGIDAVRSVVAPRDYKKEHKGQKGGPSDPLGILQQSLDPLLSKRYPDASRPEQKYELNAVGLPEALGKIQGHHPPSH